MSHYDYKSQRLWVSQDISAQNAIPCDRAQANYLLNVLRMEQGDHMLIFNGRDGEWKCELHALGRKKAALVPIIQERAQPQARENDLHYLFAPLKSARIDYMAQKAVEMGVAKLRPVMTQHTQERRPKLDKMRLNIIEAAEQCGILSIPPVEEPVALNKLLDQWHQSDPNRLIIFCDETETNLDPLAILNTLRGEGNAVPPLAVLIGPEGGFSDQEREQLLAFDFVTAIPLGPRILRADTAAIASLAIIQAVLGDWV
ncbi:MAG: 16S rRNA (uracil(1498)-N(3))-methyltransferase [Cohaesibacter sp.]|nr:16S rRNA (uracil(1498)-N(3))-methyltransferase [Cohaesibacter sp.]